MPAYGYHKVRTGCLRCKARRVKCDEKRPGCTACIRHKVRCSLADDSLSETTRAVATGPSIDHDAGYRVTRCKSEFRMLWQGDPRASVAAGTLKSSQLRPGTGYDQVMDKFQAGVSNNIVWHRYAVSWSSSARSSTSSSPSSPSSSLGVVLERELMAHWLCNLGGTMPWRGRMLEIWMSEVPRLGLRFGYLRWQMQAVAAYHLSTLHEADADARRRYDLVATRLQGEALAQFRDALLGAITLDNVVALLSTALLLVIGGFKAYRDGDVGIRRGDDAVTLNGLINLLVLLGGFNGVLGPVLAKVHSGPIAVMRSWAESNPTPSPSPRSSPSPSPSSSPDPDTAVPSPPPFLAVLRRHIDALYDALLHPSHASLNPASRADCLAALLSMRTLVHNPHLRIPAHMLTLVFAWPHGLPRGFVDLLNRREPAAVAVLAHYVAAIRIAESNAWFMKGTGRRVAGALENLLRPDSVWWPLARWAIEMAAERDIVRESGRQSGRQSVREREDGLVGGTPRTAPGICVS